MTKGFGVYFHPTATTSGQRFFRDLCRVLSDEAVPLDRIPAVVLFNVSAPWMEIVKAKWRRQKIVLRVDGLYFDRISQPFLSRFRWPLRLVLSSGGRLPAVHDLVAHVANFLDQNYKAFLRVVLADKVIYQSQFSQQIYHRYFPRKPYSIIVNGSILRSVRQAVARSRAQSIRVATIYDEWRPSKRVSEIVMFVDWINRVKQRSVTLTILGYTGKVPACTPAGIQKSIEGAPHIDTLPPFAELNGVVGDALQRADIYLSFCYRDACPNAVVEAMSNGLPVVGLASGGVPDIVGHAGKLVPVADAEGCHFVPHRFECDFPLIDFEQMYAALEDVLNDLDAYRQRVRERFEEQLDLALVAKEYATVLRELA